MGMGSLPDMPGAREMRVYISDKPRVPIGITDVPLLVRGRAQSSPCILQVCSHNYIGL